MIFKSVNAALLFWRRWQEALRVAMALPMYDRIQGGMPQRENLLATCLSIEICVRDALTIQERGVLDWMFNQPDRKISPEAEMTHHRAMSKLGKVMRERGIVG